MESTLRHGIRRSVSGIALGAALAVATVPARAADTWQLDTAHTFTQFTVRHLFTPFTGKFKQTSGTISLDAAKPENSTVEIHIVTASISTDVEKRDNHLRSDDFFNAEKYPEILFKSTKITATGTKNVYKVDGNLTIRDVTKPVTVQVEMLGSGTTSGGREVAGFLATGAVNRLDYGVKWNANLDNGGVVLGDEVKFEVAVEAIKQAS